MDNDKKGAYSFLCMEQERNLPIFMSSRLNLTAMSNTAGMFLHLKSFDVNNEFSYFSSIHDLVYVLLLYQQKM